MEKGNFFQEFIAGNTGGLIGISVVYPLDTAKIRLQVYPKQYTSTYHVMSTMIKNDGITSIYRGIASPALGFGLTFAISFSAYGFGCRTISIYKNQAIDKLSLTDMTLSGAFTGKIY